MQDIDGIVLPGGESTAMGLIGNSSVTPDGKNVWDGLKEFITTKPTWGTCAGMILLADKCVGASAVIENGQSLIGGMDILVCRNYFGSQISSFEMATPPPPPTPPPSSSRNQRPASTQTTTTTTTTSTNTSNEDDSYPGVFIRAPAILSAGPGVHVLGRVVATPCRQAAVVLQELERKIANGEQVVQMGVVDSLERKSSQQIEYRVVVKGSGPPPGQEQTVQEEKKEGGVAEDGSSVVVLPGAADGSNAREVICAVQRDNVLCTAFHPELTNDYRWHAYFKQMVEKSLS